MNAKSLILLRTLLKSTSYMNILKTTNDRKKKGKIIGSYIGMAILYLMLIGLTIFLYELAFNIIFLFYKKMNSIMKTGSATGHDYKEH